MTVITSRTQKTRVPITIKSHGPTSESSRPCLWTLMATHKWTQSGKSTMRFKAVAVTLLVLNISVQWLVPSRSFGGSAIIAGSRGGLTVSALDSGLWGQGCDLFFDKTLNSHIASFHHKYKRLLANCRGNLAECLVVICDGVATVKGKMSKASVASFVRHQS